MTSNLGAKIIQESGDKLTKQIQQQVWRLVQETFPPEFINRLDQIIMYEPLTKPELTQIVELQIQAVQKRLTVKKINLKVSEPAKEYLAEAGYDPIYGARPLKRVIQTEVLDPLAMLLLDDDIEGKTLKVDITKSGLKLSIQ
jgi:ATP-dependent Clp protease ATP-binding subunit ClpB